MSSAAKLSMSLDDIIQANRTAPTPKKEKVRARPRHRFPSLESLARGGLFAASPRRLARTPSDAPPSPSPHHVQTERSNDQAKKATKKATKPGEKKGVRLRGRATGTPATPAWE